MRKLINLTKYAIFYQFFIYYTDQNAGDYMATGAGRWHGGVNKGASLEEALNITSHLWASLISRHERCVCEGPRVHFVPDYVSRTGLLHAKAFNCKSANAQHLIVKCY